MAEITCWLTDPFGVRVFPLAHYDRLVYTRAINDVGELQITLPGTFDRSLVRVDGQVQVWRDNKLDTETAWLIRKIRPETDQYGVTKNILTAYSGLYLVDGRIVLSDFGSTATKTGPADDSMKGYVRENMGTLAATDRLIDSALFTVAADLTLGASVTHEGARQNLLQACQDLAKASTEAGTPLYFDVVYLPDTSMWEFRTYTGARGTDKSSTSGAPVTLSVEYGSVGSEWMEDDYRNEVTVVYAVGQGNGAGRMATVQSDTTRSGRSPFGRRETYMSTSSEDSGALDSAANAELQRGRPRRIYEATIVSTSASQYGRDWTLGDIVTAQAYDQQFDCRVDAVTVTIDNLSGGRESVRTRLTNTANL